MFSIRGQQCLISRRAAKNVTDKYLHTLNAIKYASGILVIVIGSFPRIVATRSFDAEGNIFLLCATFNSAYSFFWDIVMDWGLAQPEAPTGAFGLRVHRLYRHKFLYYIAILLDFLLRILWVTKWWESWEGLGADFKFIAEVSEVTRRTLWNLFRIEWQAIKVTHAGNKKRVSDFNKLMSRDSIEFKPLPQSLEESDDNDAETRASVAITETKRVGRKPSPVRRKSGGSTSPSYSPEKTKKASRMHHRLLSHAESPL